MLRCPTPDDFAGSIANGLRAIEVIGINEVMAIARQHGYGHVHLAKPFPVWVYPIGCIHPTNARFRHRQSRCPVLYVFAGIEETCRNYWLGCRAHPLW